MKVTLINVINIGGATMGSIDRVCFHHILTIFNVISIKAKQHGIMLYHIRHMSHTKYISYRINLCIQV